ncbi:MAG: hypothetical protein J6C26_08930 [Clostridia bacterium]|nr:hypothetical protein [Clostridia bacterium]
MKCYNCNATEAAPLVSCPDVGVCGTAFDPKNLQWNKVGSSAAYVNKVFSAHKATGSSLFYALNTAENAENFVSAYELTPCTGGGCCCSQGLSSDAVFEIRKSYVQLDCFSVNETAAAGEPSAVIGPENVTVNGTPVGGVTQSNGVYTADISTLPLNPVCLAQGLPSKAYILLQNIGSLRMRLRLGFEGVVRSCGALYRFKVYIANNEAILLPVEQTTSFAVAEANIPCTENGNTPVLTFRFGGGADVINPVLSVAVTDDTDPCNGVTVNLTATLGITPKVYAEVVRNTLMLINGAELCDDCPCGLAGFEIFAGHECCNGTVPSQPSPSSGLIRPCGCNGKG